MSHRDIEKNIFGIDSPSRGGGFHAMNILHGLGIDGDKKGSLKNKDLDNEIKKASGIYKETLLKYKDYLF